MSPSVPLYDLTGWLIVFFIGFSTACFEICYSRRVDTIFSSQMYSSRGRVKLQTEFIILFFIHGVLFLMRRICTVISIQTDVHYLSNGLYLIFLDQGLRI